MLLLCSQKPRDTLVGYLMIFEKIRVVRIVANVAKKTAQFRYNSLHDGYALNTSRKHIGMSPVFLIIRIYINYIIFTESKYAIAATGYAEKAYSMCTSFSGFIRGKR